MYPKYAQIIVNNRSAQVDKPYTYRIGEDIRETIELGMRVVIPFGRGNKPIKGIAIAFTDLYEEDYELKEVIDILDDKPLISSGLIELSLWMRDFYLSSYLDAFQPILPPGDFKEVNTIVEFSHSDFDYIDLNSNERAVVEYVKSKKRVLLDDLRKDIKVKELKNILKSLEDKNLIETSIDIKSTVNKKYEKIISLSNPEMTLDDMLGLLSNRATRQREIINFLYPIKNISFRDLSQGLGVSLSTVKELEKKKIIAIYEREVTRNPIKEHIEDYDKQILTYEQKRVFNRINHYIANRKGNNKFLIHGVTGSGKTEIYLQLVEEVLRQGRDSIILVPEISLTPQTIDRFVGRFGNSVAVLHSRLSSGERFDQWRRIKSGKVNIVVGARSAIFAPFNNLGLIIIDEEHESSYKSSQNPRYNTREIAKQRADIENACLILASATPSLESYKSALEDELILLELDSRINNRAMPEVKVIDMREELNKGNKSIFSQELFSSIEENLAKGKQTILFLNRRGFSTFISCRKCGYVVKCNDCDISMTYHRNINKLKCHYCGLTADPPSTCPSCKSNYIKYFGIGTEKVEELTRSFFPHARIERMDMDTTRKKGSHEKRLKNMKDGKVDILIGTQMISKGLDFENVTLVGILAADTSLNLPDFRSAERSFQLITQVAGRSGRGEHEGKVILQTYNPDHYSISLARKHDYGSFYKIESPLRKEFLYPPYISLTSILIYGENNNQVASLAKEVYNLLIREMAWFEKDNINKYIIGPYPAPIEKIKNNYRWQILIKSQNKNINNLKILLRRIIISNEYKLNFDNIRLSIDIDPNTIL